MDRLLSSSLLILRVVVVFAITTAVSAATTTTATATATATEAVADTPPVVEQVFHVSYSTSTCSGSAISVMGFLTNETYIDKLKIFEDDDDTNDTNNDTNDTNNTDTDTTMMTCGEQAVCLVDSESDRCMATILATHGPYYFEKKSGEIFWMEGEDDKFIAGPDKCIQGDWYPACHYDYVTLSDLKENPEKQFRNTNSNPENLDQIIPFVYSVYYSDTECTDLTAILTFLSGEDITVPNLLTNTTTNNNTLLSCREATLCAIDSNSTACKNLQLGEYNMTPPSIIMTNKEDGYMSTYVHDPTNIVVNEDVDQIILPTTCGTSSAFPNCYYRTFSGIYLATHPRAIIGDFTSSINSSSSSNDGNDDNNNNNKNKNDKRNSFDFSDVNDTDTDTGIPTSSSFMNINIRSVMMMNIIISVVTITTIVLS